VTIPFRERISSFGSLLSLIAVTAMLAVYALSLPEILVSPLGRAFAAAWAAAAIVIFIAHAHRLSGQRRRLPAVYRAAGRGRQPYKELRRPYEKLRD
jgi:hypothetical protein